MLAVAIASGLFAICVLSSKPLQESKPVSEAERAAFSSELELREKTLKQATWKWVTRQEASPPNEAIIRWGETRIQGSDVLYRTQNREGAFRNQLLSPSADWGVDYSSDGKIRGIAKKRPRPRVAMGMNYDSMELMGLKTRYCVEPLSTIVRSSSTRLEVTHAILKASFQVLDSRGGKVQINYEFDHGTPYRIRSFRIGTPGDAGHDFGENDSFEATDGVWHPVKGRMGSRDADMGGSRKSWQASVEISDFRLESTFPKIEEFEAALRDLNVNASDEFTAKTRLSTASVAKLKEDAAASSKAAQEALAKATANAERADGPNAKPNSQIQQWVWIGLFVVSAAVLIGAVVMRKRTT